MATALGAFIRCKRTSLGLRQKQVALDLGVDVSYLSGLESGRRRYLGEAMASRLGGCLGLTPAERETLEYMRQAARGHVSIAAHASAEEIETIVWLANRAGGGLDSACLAQLRALACSNPILHQRAEGPS